MTKVLSAKQQRILEFIHEFYDEHGYPPTVRDIQLGCEVSSTSVVDYNLRILEREGHLRRQREVSRGMQLTSARPGHTRGGGRIVPLLGQIAAGQPIPVPAADTWSTFADTVEVPPRLIDDREGVFALRVRGDSMIDALVGDGDIVLLEAVPSVENGEMAAVWLKSQQEVTLKRFYHQGAQVRLQPANPTMVAIVVPADDVEVQGRVVAVLRRV